MIERKSHITVLLTPVKHKVWFIQIRFDFYIERFHLLENNVNLEYNEQFNTVTMQIIL